MVCGVTLPSALKVEWSASARIVSGGDFSRSLRVVRGGGRAEERGNACLAGITWQRRVLARGGCPEPRRVERKQPAGGAQPGDGKDMARRPLAVGWSNLHGLHIYVMRHKGWLWFHKDM